MSRLVDLHNGSEEQNDKAFVSDTIAHNDQCDGKPTAFDYFSTLENDATEELDALVPAADGLIRLREHPEGVLSPLGEWHPSRESVRFPQESLHSFQFSSSVHGGPDLLEFRRSAMSRSIDFVKHNMSCKLSDTLPAHYSPASLLTSNNAGRNKTKSVGYSPKMHFGTPVEHFHAIRRRQKSHPTPHIQQVASARSVSPLLRQQDNSQELACQQPLTSVSPTSASASPASSASVSSSSSSRSTTPITPNDSELNVTPSHCTPAHTPTMTFYPSFKSPDHDSSHGSALKQEELSSEAADEIHSLKDAWSASRRPSGMYFPQPALHVPSRFIQHNQAILTTYDDWRIILSSDVATFVLMGAGGSSRGLVGKSVIDFIEESYRSRFFDMVSKRREELSHLEENAGGMVLVCGNVLPIVKQDGTRSAASLWLKEKRNEAGSPVYIWIFEEVFETVVHASLDSRGIIRYIDDTVQALYGYASEELLGQPIRRLIPALDETPDWDHLRNMRYFGSKTKLGATFPVITKLHTICRAENGAHTNLDPTDNEHMPCFTLRITSLPMIAGLITIRRDGIIEGCNAVFANYMFGYSQEELVTGNTDMARLMPQLPALLQALHRDDLLQQGIIINNLICRKLVSSSDAPTSHLHASAKNAGRRLTQTPNGQPLPLLIAVHRDGSQFEIQLQLKQVEGSDNVCALWITFDRDQTFSRFGHAKSAQRLDLKPLNGLGLPELRMPESMESAESLVMDSSFNDQPACEPVPDNPPTPIVTSFSKPTIFSNNSSFSPVSPVSPVSPSPTTVTGTTPTRSLPSSLAFTPITDHATKSEPQLTRCIPETPEPIEYSAQTTATTIDDYIILDTLGQGAYGLVKVAVRKDDPEQKKVVIKFVIKSRILVDCWTKDRKLGVIPVEIHILHTLRKIPHKNCSDMLDYFEDDDHYYIVMGLHGAGMDLFDYIEINNGMEDNEIRSIFKQVAEAVRHLHTHKIVHRDIKDENVVLDQNGGVRLIDFGSAAYLKGRRYDTFVGTLDYAAPEILAGQTYEGPPQDIWALGILLYTLVYRENPFYDIDEILSRDLRVPFVKSEGTLDLIRKMLDRNVEQRLTIHDVLAHPWITQGN